MAESGRSGASSWIAAPPSPDRHHRLAHALLLVDLLVCAARARRPRRRRRSPRRGRRPRCRRGRCRVTLCSPVGGELSCTSPRARHVPARSCVTVIARTSSARWTDMVDVRDRRRSADADGAAARRARRLLRRRPRWGRDQGARSSGPGVAADQVDYVIMGQVLQAGAGQIPARQAAVAAGIPMDVPALTDQQGVPVGAGRDRAGRPADPGRRVRDRRRRRHGVDDPGAAPAARSRARASSTATSTMVDHMAYDGLH